jgi:hypothetical protein
MHYKPKYSVFTLDWGISFNNLIYCSNLNEPNRSFLSVYNTLVSEKMFFIKISWRERESYGVSRHFQQYQYILAISWLSVLLVEGTRRPGEYHRPVASH